MVVDWVGKPVQVHGPGVAGVGCEGEANLRPAAAIELRQRANISDDHIRTRARPGGRHFLAPTLTSR